jgi:hypothetical protein
MGFTLVAPPKYHDYWSDGDPDDIDLKITWEWSFWTKHSVLQTFSVP